MSFIYFVLAILVSPLFAYRLYHSCQEYPDALTDKRQAKKVFVAFIVLSLISGVFLICLFPNELSQRLYFVISIFLGSFAVVAYLTNKEKMEFFLRKILKRLAGKEEQKPQKFRSIKGGKDK